MLTLLQFVCLDSVGAIYRPLVAKQYHLVFYFVGIILVVPIVLMNLVTAVIVESAIEQAGQDREARAVHQQKTKKHMIRELARIFTSLDEDGSGKVSLAELRKISLTDKDSLAYLTGGNNTVEIFKALDVNNDGELSIKEFCDGIWQVAISKTPLEVKRMELQINQMHVYLRETLPHMQRILQSQQTELHNLQAAFRAEQAAFRDGMTGCQRDILASLHQAGKDTGSGSQKFIAPDVSKDRLGSCEKLERFLVECPADTVLTGAREYDQNSKSTPSDVVPRRSYVLLNYEAEATELHIQRLQNIQQEVLQLRQEGLPNIDISSCDLTASAIEIAPLVQSPEIGRLIPPTIVGRI